MILVKPEDVDAYVSPRDADTLPFSSMDTAQKFVDEATQIVVGYLPESYRKLLHRVDGLVIRVATLKTVSPGVKKLPRIVDAPWVTYSVNKVIETEYGPVIGEAENPLIVDPVARTTTATEDFILNVVFDEDISSAIPQLLKKLVCTEVLLRMYELFPDWFVGNSSMEMYMKMREEQDFQLLSLRKGQLRLDYDNYEFATKPGQSDFMTMRINFGGW